MEGHLQAQDVMLGYNSLQVLIHQKC